MFKKEIEKRLGQQLGEGGEKTVFLDRGSPEHVIGFFHEHLKETPQQIKGRFYLTKILHLLFPKQIPDMHLASSEPHMIEVDRIRVNESNFGIRPLLNKTQKNNDTNSLVSKINKLGVSMDSFSENFKYDQAGNLVYLDSVNSFVGDSRRYNREYIREALEKLENPQKEQGLDFLKRLEELYWEHLALIKNSKKITNKNN